MNALPLISKAGRTLSPLAVLTLVLLGSSCTTSDEENLGQLAALDRECRTTSTMGSKLRQSVCMSKAEWAATDMANAERIVQQEQTSAFLRRMEDYRAMNPVKPGDRYNPYPSQ